MTCLLFSVTQSEQLAREAGYNKGEVRETGGKRETQGSMGRRKKRRSLPFAFPSSLSRPFFVAERSGYEVVTEFNFTILWSFYRRSKIKLSTIFEKFTFSLVKYDVCTERCISNQSQLQRNFKISFKVLYL